MVSNCPGAKCLWFLVLVVEGQCVQVHIRCSAKLQNGDPNCRLYHSIEGLALADGAVCQVPSAWLDIRTCTSSRIKQDLQGVGASYQTVVFLHCYLCLYCFEFEHGIFTTEVATAHMQHVIVHIA